MYPIYPFMPTLPELEEEEKLQHGRGYRFLSQKVASYPSDPGL